MFSGLKLSILSKRLWALAQIKLTTILPLTTKHYQHHTITTTITTKMLGTSQGLPTFTKGDKFDRTNWIAFKNLIIMAAKV